MKDKNQLLFLYLGHSLKWVQVLKKGQFDQGYGHKILMEVEVCFKQEI